MPDNPHTTPDEAARPKPETRKRANVALRISLVCIAAAVIALSVLVPSWIDRSVTKVNHDLLQDIAEDTARQVIAQDWTIGQATEYADDQAKLGNLKTDVAVTVTDNAVTVSISATSDSANPFAETSEIRIDVSYTLDR